MSNQISVTHVREFIASNKIPLAATQSKLSIPIITRICRKMSHGIKFDEIKVCDDLIIDGHHRYLSSLLIQLDIGKVLTHKTSATQPVEWADIVFDEEDWDTTAKIAYLNEMDAKYNGLEIEFVNRIALGGRIS
jgi:hypothetical protein